MKQLSKTKIQITIPLIMLIMASLACNYPDATKVLVESAIEHCFPVSREQYESSAIQLGETPQLPKYPESAVYEICQVEGQTTSVRMTDGEKPDDEIPAGTYTGESNFFTTLDNDVDDSYLEPICKENIVKVVIASDGTANGEIRSICSADRDTDNEEMRTTHHSEVTGVIQGNWLDDAPQLSIAYTWHTYFTSPQWETPSLDKTIDFVFPYHVQVLDGVMTLTPAAEVEGYYTLTLHKE